MRKSSVRCIPNGGSSAARRLRDDTLLVSSGHFIQTNQHNECSTEGHMEEAPGTPFSGNIKTRPWEVGNKWKRDQEILMYSLCYKHDASVLESMVICLVLLQEAMFSVALEVAFPQCAIVQLSDKKMKNIRDWEVENTIIAGSSAEGLAMGKGWGHPQSDLDEMTLYRGPLVVHVPQAHQPPGCSALRYRPEGCPPAYCKIQVTDVYRLLGTVLSPNDGLQLDESCIHESKGVYWLHTQNTVRKIPSGYLGRVSGPAFQRDDLNENISTLVCSAAHPDLQEQYVQRPRYDWPSPKQLEVIKQLPMLLVLVGHKLSNPDEIPLQARISWSLSEIFLISGLPKQLKQAYIAVKYAFKFFMTIIRGANPAGDGRSHVGSYHLKTVFLRHLERNPPTYVRSQLGLIFGLLYDLDSYLKAGKLPHYFLPSCDLLATVRHQERRVACKVTNHILSDPLRAILTCPTDPKSIYGEVPPDALVTEFHQVSSQLTYRSSSGNLLKLFSSLDNTRKERYLELRFNDKAQDFYHDSLPTFRTELTGLVAMLWEQMQ